MPDKTSSAPEASQDEDAAQREKRARGDGSLIIPGERWPERKKLTAGE